MTETIENAGHVEPPVPPEVSLEELERQAQEFLALRGKPVLQEPQTPTVQPSDTIPGTDIEAPFRYSEWSYEDQMAYIAQKAREKAVAESTLATEKAVASAKAEMEKQMNEFKSSVMPILAPVYAEQGIKKAEAACPEEARPYIGQALDDLSKMVGRQFGVSSDTDAQIVAGQAALIAQRARDAAVPTVELGEGAPQGGGDPKVLRWLSQNQGHGVTFTYDEAVEVMRDGGLL